MVGIIDYGVGNLRSIHNAFALASEGTSTEVQVIENASDLAKYDKIVLPGVGAFSDAMKNIRDKGFDQELLNAQAQSKPILGICLGMQLLATRSFEYGEHKGLDMIPGDVKHFSTLSDQVRVPHIGWNEVSYATESPLFIDIEDRSDFYFVHSYYYKCEDNENSMAITDYGKDFSSVIARGSVYGAQFHPEKSQRAGLQMLANFLRL